MVPDRSHGGHWRIIAAVIGCLAVYGGLAAGESIYDHNSPNPDRYPKADHSSPKPTAPIQYQDTRQSGGYRAYCREPKDREDSDLCAQWSGVEAVREGNRIAQSSVVWTSLEFGALLLTLGVTSWAAWAAVRAAR